MSKQRLFQFALVVRDYDEAIDYYTRVLGFQLKEDTVMSETKRWVVVKPGEEGCQILLAKAVGEEQSSRIGNQTGGRVFLFLHTDDYASYHNRLMSYGVKIIRIPARESYGWVFVFEDLYGNLWDVIQPLN